MNTHEAEAAAETDYERGFTAVSYLPCTVVCIMNIYVMTTTLITASSRN